jgi:hypothetical protein
MKSGRISTAIGLTVSIGPVIAAHLLSHSWMLDQLGAVILLPTPGAPWGDTIGAPRLRDEDKTRSTGRY